MASRPKRTTRSTASYIDVVSDDDYDPSDNGDYEHDVDSEDAGSDVSYYDEDEGRARKKIKPDDDIDFHVEDQTDDEHGATSDEDAAECDLEIEEESDVAEEEEQPASKPSKSKSRAKKVKFSLDADHNPRSFAREPLPYKFSFENPLNFDGKPLFTIAEFFEDLSDKLKMEYGTDLIRFCKLFREKPLNVVTFCSGTESPILAIGLVQKTIEAKYGSDYKFVTRHQASAEIHPAKAAYIETNFPCDVIFRDIVEIQMLWKKEAPKPHYLTTMYGGKARVPEDTDILIAGFACDDFSSLNNARKALDDKGESGDTFYAIIAYADLYKPKMIILENVMTAPWTDEHAEKWAKKHKDKPCPTSIKKHLENFGYFSIFLKMDTKNHYIPHTRNRGYMIAIHRASFPSAHWTALEKKCTEMIVALQHAATVPVEAMLFPSDDPRLEVLDQERKSDNKTVKWEKCKIGHHDYCVDHGLGEKHPITGWKGDGSKEMPDFHRPMPGMTERVADSIDIASKRNLIRGFDDRYLNRPLELSQNCFRVEDSSRNGLQQCLTPTNIAFSTYQGRRLAGAEAATLQGIDLNLVDTTRLSEALLTDMCGNAMSSTVVGTVILAALFTFQDAFKLKDRNVAPVEPEPQPASNLEEDNVEVVSNSSSYFPASVENILSFARETIRLCFCEGRHKTDVKTTFVKCRICGHTACSKCGKNPSHDYENFESQFIRNRKPPTTFEALIKQSIPKEIDLSSLCSEGAKSFLADLSKAVPQDFNQEAWNCVLGSIEKALLSRVFLRSIRRTECWTVEYDSPHAIIKLIVSGGCVEWRLFANAKDLPLASAAGKYIRRFPIARMIPIGPDIVQGPWGFWIPAMKTFDATITSRGPLIPTYTNAAGLTDVLKRYNHQFLDVKFKPGFDARYFSEPLEGCYVASPVCGQAFNTMHIQQGREPGKKPLGLFFDHELQTGNPAYHNFKFSTDFRRPDWGEYIEAVAEIPSSWRQPIIFAIEDPEDSTIRVQGTDTVVHSYNGEIVDQIKIITHGRFVAIHNRTFNLSGSVIRYHKLPVNISRVDFTCGKDLAIFTCQGKISHTISCLLPKNRTVSIDRKIGASFWREFLWFLEKGLQIQGHTEADADWHPSTGITKECPSCAPKAPVLLWLLMKGKYTPYEHPEQASAWEKGMKSRPAPMKVLFRIDDYGNIAFQVSMDPATLMHRAKARLLANGGSSDIKMDFRLVTDYNRQTKPVYEPLTIKNNDGVELAGQPFERYTLRDEQRRVVTWMRETERSGMPFIEEEVVESTVQEIGYRAEGRATREVLRCGGILAQDVGFGKTVVMLALIKKDLEITQETMETTDENAGAVLPGAIPTNATLILLPSHLVDQWHSEILKFLPDLKNQVIVIGSGKAAHFAKLTIREVLRAKVIIVAWDNCTKPPYLKVVANLAGLVEPAVNGTSERAYGAWYQVAVANIETNVDHLRTKGPAGFVDHIQTQWQRSVVEASSVDVRVPSKHITGAAYVNSDKRSSAKNDGNPNSKKRKQGAAEEKAEEFSHSISFTDDHWESMNNAILEMFRFKRIIIDELTYRKGWVNSNLKNLKALHRWLLTGTPPKGNHADVKSLAELLQVNLGVDDFTGLRSDIFNKKTSDLTKSELFLMAQEAPSTPWLERRHLRSQLFLNTFCRKDAAEVSHIELKVHICLVDLSPSEKAIYLELLQFLAATEFILKRGKSAKGDRSDQIQQVVPSSGDGKPALFLRASQFTFPGVRDTSELCDMIVVRRKNELQAHSDQFKTNLKQTIWLHKQEPECPRFKKFTARVESHKLGDTEVSKQLEQYISQALARYRKDDWQQFYRKKGTDIIKCKSNLPEYPTSEKATGGHSHLTRVASEIRTSISKLNNDVEEIINQTRALRFFQNILLIQRCAELVCARCGVAKLTPAKVKVMGQCGHLLGLECCKDNDCPVSGCYAYNREYQKLEGSTLVGSRLQWCSEHGSKIDEIIKLVRSIVSEKEKVLIFAQWSESTDKLEEALVAAKVPFSDLRKEATSSKTLQHFQNGTPPKKGAKVSQVLIMNIGDANASGSNLTMANHVIFMQPYYTSGENAQETYESAMTQAIGRARRWGQEKHVHVYHFLTVNTIDVDYYEARTDTTLARDPADPSRGVVEELQGRTDWTTHLGTYFAKTMKFDGAKRKGY